MGMRIILHGNGNNTPVMEWEWEGIGKIVDGDGNDPFSHAKNSHVFSCCCRLAVGLSSLHCSYNTEDVVMQYCDNTLVGSY